VRSALFSALIFSLTYTPSAFASPGWSAPLTLTNYVIEDSGLSITVNGDTNLLGCSQGAWLRIHPSDANFSAVVATILTAYVQHSKIRVWESDCESDGQIHFHGAWMLQ
jgi:hypothetical protein